MSWVIITNNSEKYLYGLLNNVLKQMEDNEQLIIVDNLSEDETVPIIVELIGERFIEEEKYKFYINSHKKPIGESREVAKKIANGNKMCFIDKQKIERNYLKKKRREANVTI